MVALCTSVPAAGQSGAAAGSDPAVVQFQADVESVLGSPGWTRATWGVIAVSLDTGDTLFAHNPDTPLVPASNVKLLTTAAALHYLGGDFRYRTFALATGPVVKGVLQGDLVLYGTGDPGLSDRFHPSRGAVFDTLAAQLRGAGIERVAGRVLGDGTFFSGPDRVADWDAADLNDWFAAASPALSYNENVVTLRVEATRAGEAPRVHTLPDHGGSPISNEARTVGGRPSSRLIVERPDPLEATLVRGDLPTSAPDVWRRLTVQDPVLFAAHGFLGALEAAGIVVDGGPGRVTDVSASALGATKVFSTQATGGPRVVAEYRSPPLREYLAVINQESHNLFADMVLRTVGRVVEGEGSYAAGARAVERYLYREVGLPEGSVHLVDGSGLAATNRAPPSAFVAVMDHLARSPVWETFWATLPEAGGRQLRRMRQTQAAGNLRAKTGTIRGVSALSGMVRTHDGERIAFSIVGNALPSAWGAKRLEDRIGARLASLTRALGDGDRSTLTGVAGVPASARR
jgi:D-alanyl-D-alanine carboxypeptidase/D-alanyl-D-alanine-endopeptidase (penicillin-binding protein 4)